MKRWGLIPLVFVGVGILVAAMLQPGRAEPQDRIGVRVEIPAKVEELDLTELWGRMSAATGTDPDGATLEELRLTWGEDGRIHMLTLQILTDDGYLLDTAHAAGDTSARIHGVKAGETPQDHLRSTPLDRTFAVIDGLGLRSIENFQAPVVDRAPGSVFGIGLEHTGRNGSGKILWMSRAYLFDGGRFIRLHPDDQRREFRADTVAFHTLILEPMPSYFGTRGADALTYYLVPPDAWPPDLGDPRVVAPVR